jgi:hypothetical protein
MTVCIAAICDSGKAIVVAADRMFTNPGLSVEFETPEQKIEQLATRCVALAAGNSVHATEVLESVRRRLGGNPAQTFHQVAEFLKEEYASVRARKAYETLIFSVLGADFERHRAVGMPLPTYLEKQSGVFQQMVMFCQQYKLGVEFLITGLDDSGAHLSHVTDPGVLSQLQKLGHAAIGSGGPHAMTRLSLAGQSRQRGLLETIADVYSAKRASEVAPGVGNATDVAVIDMTHGVWPCPQPVIDELESIHRSISATLKPNLDNLRARYDEQRPKT